MTQSIRYVFFFSKGLLSAAWCRLLLIFMRFDQLRVLRKSKTSLMFHLVEIKKSSRHHLHDLYPRIMLLGMDFRLITSGCGVISHYHIFLLFLFLIYFHFSGVTDMRRRTKCQTEASSWFEITARRFLLLANALHFVQPWEILRVGLSVGTFDNLQVESWNNRVM